MDDRTTHKTLERRLANAEAALVEAREREADLRARESRFRCLFDSLDDGMAIVELIYDGHGGIVDMVFREVNAAYERQGGIYDVIGRSVVEMLPSVEDVWLERYRRVARTGEPLRVEDYQRDVDRWFDVYFSRIDADGRYVAIVFKDISERKRAEVATQRREQRQAFLLRFSDTLRAEPSVDAVAFRALHMLSEEMQLDRSYVAVYRPDENRADVTHQVGNEHVPPLPDMFVLSEYPEAFEAVREETFVVEDDFERRGLSEAERRNSKALGMRAMLASTLRKGVRHPLWSVMAISASPRRWTQEEIALVEEVAERTWSAMEQARADAAVRESEERQAFLLRLGDAMRAQPDAEAIIKVAARLLGRRLNASRIMFAEFDEAKGIADIFHGWFADGAEPFPSVMDLEEYEGPILDDMRAGRTVRIDSAGIPPFDRADLVAIAEVGVRALLTVPLLIGGRLTVNLSVHQDVPRQWTDSEVSLVRDVAERLWADLVRARAMTALRQSEARFQQFATSSSGALWVRDATTLDLEYASSAIEAIYGIAPDNILGDVRLWARHIVPEDRGKALAHLHEARNGNSVTHEFRIIRASDGAFRWIRNTVFPLLDERGQIQRIGGVFEDVTDVKQAAEHRNVLLFELQHRVRNILAMIRSVTQRTSRTAGNVTEYRDLLDGRMRALSHIQVLLTRSANTGVDLATLVRDEVEAQVEHGSQLLLSGPELVLSPKAAEVVTLAIHELTTNALKYGALADAVGSLSVTWRVAYEGEEPWLRLDWRETKGSGPLSPPTRRGFGTELIEDRIPYELDGRGTFSFRPDGLACRLTFPLRGGDSILETDAVTLKTTIEGGSLDMAGEADLNGCRVLVVEDDYYLASDTARALRNAGAEVLGPVGNEEQALALITEQHVTCALVDINLGNGLLFRVADALKERGVSFVFVTGYDDVMIPERFGDVPRMRKPTDFRDVVRAAARMCRAPD